MIHSTRKVKNGVIVYEKNGVLHREDGPALIFPSGNVYYYEYGAQPKDKIYGITSTSIRLGFHERDKK
jgi:hypothetical protein